jgi:hypothetical protein
MRSKRAAASFGEVLMVGCEGSGKTLLCRQLERVATGDMSALKTTTQPSVGVEMLHLSHGGQAFAVREVGGVMQPVWHRYFEACAAVVLVADAATAEGAASAAVELAEVLCAGTLRGRQVLLLLNKRDAGDAMPEASLQLLLELPQLRAAAGDRLHVLSISALTGEGVAEVLAWCAERCREQQQLAEAAVRAAAGVATPGAPASRPRKLRTLGVAAMWRPQKRSVS